MTVKRIFIFRLAIALIAITTFANIAQAAIVRPFGLRFTATTRGNIILVGNTLETCAASEADCVTAQTAFTSTHTNNVHVMTYVDIDADSATFNSSSTAVTLQPAARVLWAGLYWGANLTGLPTARTALSNTVWLATPTNTNYITVTAAHVDVNGFDYQGFADVTAWVKGAGSGAYKLANVQAITGTGRYAGWSLVVAFADEAEPLRNLTVFDGYGSLSSGSTPTTTIFLNGFVTPASGPVTATLGLVTYEGDRGVGGESAKLNGVTLSNTLNPANDFFNSTLTNNDAFMLTGNPAYTNTLGFDVDTIAIDGLLENSATSATLTLSTAGETYFPGMVSFASEVFQPALAINKTVTAAYGPSNTLQSGDVLTYQIAISSVGNDVATGVILSDAIPISTTYVPGSAAITFGPNTGAQTDAVGDDVFDVLTNTLGTHLVFRLGAGATANEGGLLTLSDTPLISNSTLIRFAVQVNTDVSQTTMITNQAYASFFGGTLTNTLLTMQSNIAEVVVLSETGPPVPTPVTQTTLSLIKAVSPAVIFNGDVVTFTLVVSNAGPLDMPPASVIRVPSDTVATLGVADLYPATLNVQGLTTINDIEVTLQDVTHSYAADLDVMLVGPQGQSVLLMSDVGSTTALNHATLTFRAGASELPDVSKIVTGTYRPTDYVGNDGKDSLPAPAPTTTHNLNLATFIGTNPNGAWHLYVADDQASDIGQINKGWSLTLVTSKGSITLDSSKPVQVIDPLPTGAKFISASLGYGQLIPFGWADALPANTAKTYTLTARVERPVNGAISNTAQLQSASAVGVVANAQSVANVAVQYVALSARVPPSTTITPGATNVFTIEYCNTGNVSATGVKVTVKFPPQLSSITLPAYWVANETEDGFEGPIGTLADGACSTAVFEVVVPASWPASRNDLGVSLKIDDDGTHGLDPNDLITTPKTNVYLSVVLK